MPTAVPASDASPTPQKPQCELWDAPTSNPSVLHIQTCPECRASATNQLVALLTAASVLAHNTASAGNLVRPASLILHYRIIISALQQANTALLAGHSLSSINLRRDPTSTEDLVPHAHAMRTRDPEFTDQLLAAHKGMATSILGLTRGLVCGQGREWEEALGSPVDFGRFLELS